MGKLIIVLGFILASQKVFAQILAGFNSFMPINAVLLSNSPFVLILISLIVIATLIFYGSKQINKLKARNNELERLARVKTLEADREKENLEIANKELQKFSLIAERSKEAVVIMDAEGNIEWINEVYTRIFGYEIDELIVAKGFNIIGSNTPRAVKNYIKKVIQENKPVSYELKVLTKTGSEIWIHAEMSPIVNEEGEVIKLIAIDYEISQLKDLENKLINLREQAKLNSIKLEELNLGIDKNNQSAYYIQTALLPSSEYISAYFDNLILWKPKENVSGDFYWFNKSENKNCFYAATIDCTGHGISGALMALVSYYTLREVIFKQTISEPKDILQELNSRIVEMLHQQDNENEESLDIVLCQIEQIDAGKFLVRYAGGKRPLFIFQQSVKKLITLEASRRSVGGKRSIESSLAYEQTQINLSTGDILYLTSDGYSLQNNKYRKPFGTTNLKKLLHAIAGRPMDEQQLALELALQRYQGIERQRDDVTILGLKL